MNGDENGGYFVLALISIAISARQMAAGSRLRGAVSVMPGWGPAEDTHNLPDGEVVNLPGGARVKELSRRLDAFEDDLIKYLYLFVEKEN